MILLFGSTGYIGSEFKRQLEQLKVPFFCWQNTSEAKISKLNDFYKTNKFKFVINSAGYTGRPNVDACEKNKETTISANLIWPQILADWCEINDVVLGHVSSGCIYSGKKPDGTGFTEEDEPNFSFKYNNCSFYSGSKSLAEKIISSWKKNYVWRLRMPFEENDNPRNFLSKILNYSKTLIAENSLSNKQEFVSACLELILNNHEFGTYNVVNSGSITTDKIVEKLRTIDKNKSFTLIDEEKFYSECANAPRSNCVLDNSKLLKTGIKMRNVEEAMDYCVANWRKA